jgi:hypothetical protein
MVNDNRLNGFLVGFLQRPHSPAAVANKESTRVFVIGNYVNRLLLALLRQIDGQFCDGRLQIKMPGIEGTRLDGLKRQLNDLALYVSVFPAPRLEVFRFLRRWVIVKLVFGVGAGATGDLLIIPRLLIDDFVDCIDAIKGRALFAAGGIWPGFKAFCELGRFH